MKKIIYCLGNKFKLIFIGLFIFNVCCNSNNEKKIYYSNGILKKEIIYNKDKAGGYEINYDSIGRIVGKYNISGNLCIGEYTKFYYQKDYNIKEDGYYSDGKKFELFERYYRLNDKTLRTEIFCQRVDSTIDFNIYKRYDSIGQFVKEESCIYNLKFDKDTISMNEKLSINLQTDCFDFTKMWVIVGDFDTIYRKTGDFFDTIKCDNNSKTFYYDHIKLGQNYLRGYIYHIKPIREGLNEKWKVKYTYFSKSFVVK